MLKAALCHALEEYNRHIDNLKTEMDEATASAQLIRKDISELRNKSGIITVSQTCQLCHCPALASDMFYFPCKHMLHIDCLCDYVRNLLLHHLRLQMMQHLTFQQQSRVNELRRLIPQCAPVENKQTAPRRLVSGGRDFFLSS